MRLSPPSSKKFDSLPTGPASSSSSHTDATARSASVSGSDREDADGAASGAMPAKAFRSTFPFALKGRTGERIAAEFYISKSTVDTHLRRIYAKCGVHGRQELIDLGERTERRLSGR